MSNSASEINATRNLPPIRWTYRHTLPVRLSHWLNVVCLFILLMSGLQIFNAHPSLSWGNRSDPDRPMPLVIGAMPIGGGVQVGITEIFGYRFDTTGVLGVSRDAEGNLSQRGFPSWATIPGPQWLSMGRHWHLFFAWLFVINGLLYAAYALFSRHLSKDLIPWWKDLRGIGRSLKDHLLFHHPKGEEAAHYNVLQKLAYVVVIFALGPLAVLTGFTMSPWLNSVFPQLLSVFDGRQTARTIHFFVAFGFILFILIHVFMVIVTGIWNNLRSMITGRYAIKEDKHVA